MSVGHEFIGKKGKTVFFASLPSGRLCWEFGGNPETVRGMSVRSSPPLLMSLSLIQPATASIETHVLIHSPHHISKNNCRATDLFNHKNRKNNYRRDNGVLHYIPTPSPPSRWHQSLHTCIWMYTLWYHPINFHLRSAGNYKLHAFTIQICLHTRYP